MGKIGRVTPMCGIYGAVHLTKQSLCDVDSKLSKLSKRGPDDSGTYEGDYISLGHTRLAIQDIQNGHQPMFSRSKNFVVVFNGEIYNHFELRNLLPGHDWNTQSDTETLVELYEVFGDQIFKKIIGMYAVGIWNISSKELTLARDKYGEKPIYFTKKQDSLYFCSEAICILDKTPNIKDIQTNNFPYFLKYGYLPINQSIIKEVRMLFPGEILHWKNGNVRSKSSINLSPSKHEYGFNKVLLRKKIEEAVERTLLADDQVGVMLSGGIDSSIIAVLAAKFGGSIPTYTFALTANSLDVKYSRLVANKIKSQHHEILIDSSVLADEIENILSLLPHPFADTAVIPTYLLARFAKEQVNVLLSGDGADEVFAGYSYYNKYRYLDSVQTSKIQSFSRELKYNVLSHTRYKHLNKLREEFRSSRLTSRRTGLQDSWNQDLAAFKDSEIQYMNKSIITKISKGELSDNKQLHPFWRIINSDRLHYLSGDILQKSDIGGMLASVEIRAPYLDKEISDYLCETVDQPSQLSKKLLNDACSNLLPEEIFQRNKQGFGAPLDEWLLDPKVSRLMGSVLNNQQAVIYNFFDFSRSMHILKKSNLKKWNFFVLAFWLEKNV